MKPFISACLIVKNEEDMLRKCLESLQGGVDEIVVVDTGSTDTTKEIAKEFTDKVYDFEWTNDFAEARNFAASKASGEWILAIDADECVDPKNLAAAIEEIKSHDNKFDVYAVEINSFSDKYGENLSMNHMQRIYKNNGEFHFSGAIHEQIVEKGEGRQELVFSALKLYHYGYLPNVVKKKNKRKRNMDILKKALKSNNNDGFTYFNYGQELRSLGKTKEALESFIKAYQNKEDVYKEWVSRCLYFIVEMLVELKRYEEAIVIINDAEEVFSTAPDFPFWKGEIYFKQKRFDDAKEVYTHIISNNMIYQNAVFNAGAKTFLPHVRLGEIYTQERQHQQALQHYVEALNENDSSVKIIVNIISLLSKYHTPEEIYDFISTRQIIKSDYIRTEVLKLLLDLGLGKVALLLMNDFINQQQLLIHSLQLKANMIIAEEPLQFTIDNLMYGIQMEVFDIADLIVLYAMTKDAHVQNILENSKFKHVFYNLFNKTKNAKKLKQDEYLPILEKAICFQKAEFVEKLISYTSLFPKQIHAKIADLFYNNAYEEIAMDFYQLSDENHVTKQGYVNIIEYLLMHENQEEAYRIALEALQKFKADFRFYKYSIEIEQGDTEGIISKAIQEFSDSNWLKGKLLMSI
ncbi:tetratricopeptide repeat-containing glycosyltransferase family 2 protein [Bacillus cytotoxicus]|uniref:Glycosyl transferase family 2 n=1 Tax=Bacillus cytotoxicus TaxID=580165 RepID=A0AAX2CF86_9BACI|nr:glycosyltransferase family 2 protein [Bacillus cytotoxicus]QTR82619.1 glycosyltransferase [Bacillus cytotoxicus]QTR86357.1 glycosyltransferase [Bacillus cytotoxicus]SCL89315.1 Glycosyl transferase family 2 [Bacillus cytotoxicus]